MDNVCDSLPVVTTDDGVAAEPGGVAGGIMRALREDSKASMIRSRNQVTMNGLNSRLS